MNLQNYIKRVIPGFLAWGILSLLPLSGYSQGCSYDVQATPVHVLCNGMATGSITVTASPAGSYTYLWSTGSTANSISNLEAGTYFVKVADFTGCEVISFITIKQPPVLTYDALVENPVCYNQNSGSISLTVSGGKAPYDLNWSNNVKTASNPDLYSGNYECIITDANFCTQTASFDLVQPRKIATIAEIVDVRGFGLSDGSVNISSSGGVHPYQYTWSSVSGYVAVTEDVYDIPAATYDLNIVDSKSCTYDTSIIVNQPPPLSLTAEVTKVFCNAFSDGAIDVLVSGGVPPYGYTWANSEIILTEESAHAKDLAMGSYYLTVTDYNGIQLRDTFYVDEPNPIVANIKVNDAWCFDSLSGSANLTVSGGNAPFAFLWSNGASTQNIADVGAGKYEVEIVDSKGCFLKVKSVIDQPDSIEINTSVFQLSCKDHHNGKIFTDVKGGIAPYRYEWSNGEIGESIQDLDIGEYSVTVTDDHDCPMTTIDLVDRPLNGCIEIPNAFTPNGDDYNDQWIIQNSYLYPNIEVLVLSKEGYLVFESIGYTEAWDGKHNNHDAAPGSYYYLVDLHNGDPVYKGLLTIIR